MGIGDEIANLAKSRLGFPYQTGATGPDSFDCSGLAQWAHKEKGISIPRTSLAQSQSGTAILQNELKAEV